MAEPVHTGGDYVLVYRVSSGSTAVPKKNVPELLKEIGTKEIGTVGLLKKSCMFDKIMHMDQARNSTVQFINGMEAKS